MAICTGSFAKNVKNATLELGNFSVDGEFATQVVSVTNTGKKSLERVEIECTYSGSGEIVASATDIIENIDPGESGSVEVLADNANDAEDAKCRIVSAE